MTRRATWALATAALAAASLAQAQLPATWQTGLNDRLLRERNCKVAFYSGVVERQVSDKHVVIAKAHCEDRRAFDVARHEEMEPFQIKECTPQPTAC